jgi:hypothetical protein
MCLTPAVVEKNIEDSQDEPFQYLSIALFTYSLNAPFMTDPGVPDDFTRCKANPGLLLISALRLFFEI